MVYKEFGRIEGFANQLARKKFMKVGKRHFWAELFGGAVGANFWIV
ncbi:MAG: hypothetical protein R3D03_21730 [Geminicoccaceae bacterium]